MQQPSLQSSRLVLRPFVLKDASRVHDLAGHELIAETTANIPHPYPDEAAKEWISGHAANWENLDTATFAITLIQTSTLVGAISLMNIDEQSAELGYWVGVPHWGNGYCTEAASTLCSFAFCTLGLNLVFAKYLTRNPSSGAVLRNCGFAHTGTEVVTWKTGVSENMERYELRHA